MQRVKKDQVVSCRSMNRRRVVCLQEQESADPTRGRVKDSRTNINQVMNVPKKKRTKRALLE
jgi:hypothetical protein